MKYRVFIFSLLAPLSVCFATPDNSLSEQAISKRLLPEGVVDELGKERINTTLPLDAATPERGGNEIFQQFCSVCHATGVAGAPKFGCVAAWSARKAKGMSVLIKHAQTGINFMPPKGTCSDCSNTELEEAIHYMINHSNKDDQACNKTA